jgi:hypothetical protein
MDPLVPGPPSLYADKQVVLDASADLIVGIPRALEPRAVEVALLGEPAIVDILFGMRRSRWIGSDLDKVPPPARMLPYGRDGDGGGFALRVVNRAFRRPLVHLWRHLDQVVLVLLPPLNPRCRHHESA